MTLLINAEGVIWNGDKNISENADLILDLAHFEFKNFAFYCYQK